MGGPLSNHLSSFKHHVGVVLSSSYFTGSGLGFGSLNNVHCAYHTILGSHLDWDLMDCLENFGFDLMGIGHFMIYSMM